MKLPELRGSGAKVASVSVLFICIGLIVVASVRMIVFASDHLEDNGSSRPEIVLPLLVIIGVVALLGTLAITAATFGLFEISDKGQALGLPAGSIQAVIALGLILIFAVVALYASGNTGSEQFTSEGLTGAEYRAIPTQEVVSAQRTKAQGKVTYTVVRSIEDPAAKDINIQLLTTVSTLVVAVAGFYFGSKSAQEGSATALEAAAPTRALSVVEPVSPHSQSRNKPLRNIKLQAVPPEARLRGSVQGDKEEALALLPDGSYVYTPTEEAGTNVTLSFEQVDDPKVSASLLVELEAPPASKQQKQGGGGGRASGAKAKGRRAAGKKATTNRKKRKK